jgi:hypothetical protein
MGAESRKKKDSVRGVMMMMYLQGDDAREFLRHGYCEGCLRHAQEWAQEDRYGNVLVHGAYDARDNLVGVLCPNCAEKS